MSPAAAQRWRTLGLLIAVLTMGAGALRPIIAHFKRPTLGASCYPTEGCRSGQCLKTESLMTGICTHACQTDQDCFGNFRCDARFGMCLWMATQAFGDHCEHTSQCREGDCATFNAPMAGEFRGSSMSWFTSVCVTSCGADGACPEGGTCSPQNVCVPEARVLEDWRRQRDAFRRVGLDRDDTKR